MEYAINWVRIVGAVIILVVGIILARLSSNFIKKIIEEIELDRIVQKTGFIVPLGRYFYLGVRYVVYFGAFILALRELGISSRGLEILFIIALVLVVIFIVLAFKDIFPSLIARFVYLGKYNLKKGDRIKINSIEGEIIEVGLLETQIKTRKESVFVPNSVLAKKIVIRK